LFFIPIKRRSKTLSQIHWILLQASRKTIGQLGFHTKKHHICNSRRPLSARYLSHFFKNSLRMGKQTFTSINPATGSVVATYPGHSPEEIREILQQTNNAQRQWAKTSFDERADLMQAAARELLSNKEVYARLMTEEMGKPISQGRAEVEKCADVCRYYAEHAGEFLRNEPISMEGQESYTAFRPLGVVLAVMPWNFPLWQVFRFAAPALMAGNGAVLKHASNVMGSALAIESVFRKAGFPEQLFRTLKAGSRQVAAIIEDPVVKAVTLTGSVGAGSAVAAKAGEMLKKTVMELGGSDPYLVLEDADLPAAANTCAKSRLINSGQSCIAAKRFIVVEAVYDAFLKLFVEAMRAKKMGDPMAHDTDLGPQATPALRDELHGQVHKSMEAGARCLLGGTIPQRDGAWYPATVLSEVKPGMPAYDEELFGPVASVIRAKDEQDAIRIANDTVFGLGAAVFTRNRERGREIAEKHLEAGCCFVNDFVKSDPRLPFGGIGHSGYGRELSYFGIREFTNIKAVVVK
jgi:succinate-semialdehyde dehydrogenase / glutarate-semialdehyde dehydrogenase